MSKSPVSIDPAVAACYARSIAAGQFDELTLLTEINEASIEQVLRARYDNDDMYTGIGPVLLAMNPYKQIAKQGLSIYDASIAKFYFQHTSVEVAPHIFNIASEAYKRLTAYTEDQCIIVTGESGAGKTEAAKQLMNFITHICENDAVAAAPAKAHDVQLSIATGVSQRYLPLPKQASVQLTVAQRVQRALGSSADDSVSRTPSMDGDAATMASHADHDSDIHEVFDSIAENGAASFEAVKGLAQVEELLEDGRAPIQFVQELFKAAAGSQGSALSIDGFKRFLTALEADLAHSDAGLLHATSASLDFEQAYGKGGLDAAYLSSPEAANSSKLRSLSDVKRQLLESNPILEAFGNAQTVRNDNSSRFGKYMKLQFNFNGDVVGGNITNYLLEKSRIIGQTPGERSFHVCYQLVHGADEKERALYRLGDAETYRYLMNSSRTIPDVDDSAMFRALKNSLTVVGFSDGLQKDIFSLLSSILMLGNVDFEDQGSDQAALVNTDLELQVAAQMLGVEPEHLEMSLTRHRMRGKNASGGDKRQTIAMVAHDRNASVNARDSLAKEIYKRTFDFLVQFINGSIEYGGEHMIIGILDIYGFEIFDSNGFEQFCINFVNEKLQQYFIELTLKTEQDEYVREGIQWDPVEYFNNQTVCDMIEQRPGGIYAVLDEQAAFRDANTTKFLAALQRQFGTHDHFVPPEKYLKSAHANSFGIRHYAGDVQYVADNFLEKNVDTLHEDLVMLLGESSNLLCKQMFEDHRSEVEKAKRPPSISTQFKEQVTQLMETLKACRPHYVRCIKPNDLKQAGHVDIERVCHQIKYLGLTENVRVRQAGFCYRAPFRDFFRRYRMLSSSTWPSFADGIDSEVQPVEAILSGGKPTAWKHAAPLTPLNLVKGQDYQIGHSMVFIRQPHTMFLLEEQRSVALPAAITKVQANARRYLEQARYRRTLAGFVKVQSYIRKLIAQARYRRARKYIHLVQTIIRRFIGARRVLKIRKQFKNRPPRTYAIQVQRIWRGHSARSTMDQQLYERAQEHMRIIHESILREAAATRIASEYRKHYHRKRFYLYLMLKGWLRRYLKRKREIKNSIAQLQQGVELKKWTHGGLLSGHNAKTTRVTLTDDCTRIRWGGSMVGSGKRGIALDDVRRLMTGAASEHLRAHGNQSFGDRYLVLDVGEEKCLELEFPTEHARDSAYRALRHLCRNAQASYDTSHIRSNR